MNSMNFMSFANILRSQIQLNLIYNFLCYHILVWLANVLTKNPDLPDSVIERQLLVSSQLLTGKKEVNDTIKDKDEVSYGIMGAKSFKLKLGLTPTCIFPVPK